MILTFASDTFSLFWNCFWHVWYLLPFAAGLGFVLRMYMCSTTTNLDNYSYTVEYRNRTKVFLQSMVETVSFFTGCANSVLGIVNMLKVLVMTRLGMTRVATSSGQGANPAMLAALMMQSISRREDAKDKEPRSPSMRKAIRPPQSIKTE